MNAAVIVRPGLEVSLKSAESLTTFPMPTRIHRRR
jgi:hypothetical protein